MKSIQPIALAALLSFSAIVSAQSDKIKGNGKVTKKDITTTSYDEVRVSGFFDVNLIAGSEGKITIEGEENLLNYVECVVDGDALQIRVEKGKKISTSLNKSITVTVPFESLSNVTLAGSGDINSKQTIKSSKFTTTLAGSGDINLDVEAQEVNAKVTGSGNMTLKGKAKELACSVTGSGDLDAAGLESGNVDSTVAGSGNCKVYCTDFLQAKVVGSGDIDYKGEPKKKETKVTGSGSISKA